MRLGLLVSGSLGLQLLNHLYEKHAIVFVMTDSASKTIISHCQEKQIECFVGNPRSPRMVNFIRDKSIEVLTSINYLFLIPEQLRELPKRVAFNVHGSLLPKYRGRTPHVWAIINNEKITGVTAHVIDAGCDTGDIIEQLSISIDENDTGAEILNKFSIHYPQLIDKVLNEIETNKLQTIEQDDNRSSFFGKRTPEDGKINWEWQKERIRNWVRAQAFPYPGSFTYLNGQKITIDEIVYSDWKFTYEMQNGLILSVNPHLVKTSNGVIELTKIREKVNLKIGDILQ